MALVTMIVLMVSNMFLNSSEAWDIGTRKAELTTAGRAATDFIARELFQAVAGPVEAAAGAPVNLRFILNDDGNEVKFIGLSGDPETGRALRGVLFRYKKVDEVIQVWRNTGSSSSFNPYTDQPNWDSASELIGNVTFFRVAAYPDLTQLKDGDSTLDYDSAAHQNKLPICVDIFMEILTGADMETANSPGLSDAARTDFMNKNAKGYSTRVYFPNRMGYGGDI